MRSVVTFAGHLQAVQWSLEEANGIGGANILPRRSAIGFANVKAQSVQQPLHSANGTGTRQLAFQSALSAGALCQQQSGEPARRESWMVTTSGVFRGRVRRPQRALAHRHGRLHTTTGERFCERTSARFLASSSFWLAATRYQNRASSTLALVPRARSYMTAKWSELAVLQAIVRPGGQQPSAGRVIVGLLRLSGSRRDHGGVVHGSFAPSALGGRRRSYSREGRSRRIRGHAVGLAFGSLERVLTEPLSIRVEPGRRGPAF